MLEISYLILGQTAMRKTTKIVMMKNHSTQKALLNTLIFLLGLSLISIHVCAFTPTESLFSINTKNLFIEKGYVLPKPTDFKNSTALEELDYASPVRINNSSRNKEHLTPEQLAAGGFSDGGGNAVDNLFFDFYENRDSFEITVPEWTLLDPDFESLLNKIEKAIPALHSYNGSSLKTQMLVSVQAKKIFFERKKIESIGCKNQSMVTTKNQNIVGCQSDTTIRMNLTWLLGTNTKNRLGLFLHELFLGWARKHKSQLAKEILEEQVRDFVRTVFLFDERNTLEDDLAQEFMKIFNIRAYSPKTLEAAKLIKEKSEAAQKNICENKSLDLHNLYRQEYQDQFLIIEIPNFIKNLLSENPDFKLGSQNSNYLQSHKEFCENYYLNSRDATDEPKLNLLNQECIDSLDTHIKDSVMSHKEYDELLKRNAIPTNELSYLRSVSLSLSKITANVCSMYKGRQLEKQLFMTEKKGKELMNQAYMESLHYIKFHLHRQGINLRFENKN